MGTQLSRSTLRMILILFAALALCAQFAAGPHSADAQTTITEEKPQPPDTREERTEDDPSPVTDRPSFSTSALAPYLKKGFTFSPPRKALAADSSGIAFFASYGRSFLRFRGKKIKWIDQDGRPTSDRSVRKGDYIAILRKGNDYVVAIYPQGGVK